MPQQDKIDFSDFEKQEKLSKLQQWIKTQPQLPQNIEKLLLLRYLKTYDFQVDKAQSLLKFNLELRQTAPQIFTQRDPHSDKIQEVFKTINILPLLEHTPENYKVCLMRLVDEDPKKFDLTNFIKTFFIMSDVRLITPDINDHCNGEIPIYDAKNLSYKHLPKLVLSSVRIFMKFTQEALPIRIQQIHVLNCSPIMDRTISLIRPMIFSKVFKLIHFHKPGSDTIFKYIPKEIMPEEYGGNAGPIEDLKKYWMDKVDQHRKYIMNDDNWKINNGLELNEATNKSKGIFGFFGASK